MKSQNKQDLLGNATQTIKPGKKYTRIGKILGFFALILIPALPLYMPIFCKRDIGWKCGYDELDFIFIPVYIAISLAISSITLLVIGWRINQR